MNIEQERLVQQVVARIKPPVPVDVALWDAEVIGAYLQRTANYVRNRIITQPGFPKQIRLPTGEGKRSNPLWRAKDVIAWAESFIET